MAVLPDARPALEALRDLRARIHDALVDRHPPESPDLAADLIEVHDLALSCRDAGLAYVKTGFTWAQLTAVTGLPDSTLQDRWKTWYAREGSDECA